MRSPNRRHRSFSRFAGGVLIGVLLASGVLIPAAGGGPARARSSVSAAEADATPEAQLGAPPVTWALSGNGTARGANHTPGGDVVVTGNFRGTTTLDGTTVTSAGANDVFVFALSPTGAVRWGRSFGGPLTDAGVDVDVAENGDIYVTGQFQGTMDVGAGMRAISRGDSTPSCSSSTPPATRSGSVAGAAPPTTVGTRFPPIGRRGRGRGAGS